MLIPYLTCNDIIPQKLGTNVTSTVITGLICRVREVAVRCRPALPNGPSLGIQSDPPKRWWSLAVTTLKEAEIKALPLP